MDNQDNGKKRHKLLERQIKSLGPIISSLSKDQIEVFDQFITNIDEAYLSYEKDRELVERSMELSSTELYQANKDMREQNIKLKKFQETAERLRYERELILNSVSEGIIKLSPEGKATFVNPMAAKMLGWEQGELVDCFHHDIVHHTKADKTTCTFEKCPIFSTLRNGQSHHSEADIFWRKDKTFFPLDYTISPTYVNGTIVGGVMVFRDITKRLQYEESRRDSAHRSGMAEIATGVLHNVGNILNSVNVGIESIQRIIESSEHPNLFKATTLINQHMNDLPQYITEDPKGKQLPPYLVLVGKAINAEYKSMSSELVELQKRVQLIKDVISSQQAYAKAGEFKEELFISDVLDSALAMQVDSLTRHDIKVIKKYSGPAVIVGQKAKLIHVLVNLVKNAKESMFAKADVQKTLTFETQTHSQYVVLKVTDNGEGVKSENLTKIFNHGFTTKASGHGFGLHFCANAIREMGGDISVQSEGYGKGATFTITLPKKIESSAA